MLDSELPAFEVNDRVKVKAEDHFQCIGTVAHSQKLHKLSCILEGNEDGFLYWVNVPGKDLPVPFSLQELELVIFPEELQLVPDPEEAAVE